MATFPTLIPSSRVYTPGFYPHTPFTAMSGKQNRVRHSTVMLGSRLQLSFVAITQATMLSIKSHYDGQQGTFLSFTIPAEITNGVTATDFTLTDYSWRYAEPPKVEDYCPQLHTVTLVLESVPPEGVTTTGLVLSVAASLTAGAATGTANTQGAALTVAATWSPGLANADAITATGLNITVPATLISGAATGTANTEGLALTATASFTPGAATTTPPPGPTDPNFSSVVLLLHFNGANNSTTITDNSSKGLTATAYNSAVVSTGASKFGGSSLYMTRNYLDGVDVQASTDLNFGTGDFTFEYWYLFVSRENFNYCRVFGHTTTAETSGTFRIRMAADTSGGNVLGEHILCAANSGSARVVGTRQSVIDGAWHHIAFCRSGSTIYCFRDGVLKESATDTTDYSYGSTGGLRIGSRGVGINDFSNVYIDDVRVTKGVARYTATFTPPSAQFPDN